MGRFRLSKRQAADLLAECFAIPMAVGTVVNQQQVISAALAAPVAELQPVVKRHRCAMSMKPVGDKRNSPQAQLVVDGSHPSGHLFRIAPSRSGQIASELLGDDYGGVAGTDRCSAYTWLKYRQYCWSHLLRDFQKILERGGDSYPVGLELETPGGIPADAVGTGARWYPGLLLNS